MRSDALPRAPLTRERVLRAAIAFADEHGIEALSMRRLGHELGVEAMSLYNYVANKDDLLDGSVELVLDEIELSPGAGDWKSALRQSTLSAHQVLRRHPWACGRALSPKRILPVSVRYAEWRLRQLREGGFPPELTYHAFHALDSHLMGFTLWAQGHSVVAEDVTELAETFRREFPSDEYPYLAEHADQHLSGLDGQTKSAFEFVLDVILDGLERLRDQA